MAKTDQLFEDDNSLALRQKNTEPLILPRLLKAAGDDQQLEDAARAAHKQSLLHRFLRGERSDGGSGGQAGQVLVEAST